MPPLLPISLLLLAGITPTVSAQKPLSGMPRPGASCVANCADKVSPGDEPSCQKYCDCALTFDWQKQRNRGTSVADLMVEYEGVILNCAATEMPEKYWAPEMREELAKRKLAEAPKQAERKRAEALQQAEDKQIAEARMPDGSAGLHKHAIRPLQLGDLRLERATNALRSMVIIARDQGQQVIACTYGPSRTASGKFSYSTYQFWYQQLPGNIAALRQADPNGALHWLGTRGLTSCPSSLDAAAAAATSLMPAPPTARTLPDGADRRIAARERHCAMMAENLVKWRAQAASDTTGLLASNVARAEADYAHKCR